MIQTHNWSDPSPINKMTLRFGLILASWTAIDAPSKAPTDQPIEPHNVWVKAIAPFGKWTGKNPNEEVPVSVIIISYSDQSVINLSEYWEMGTNIFL